MARPIERIKLFGDNGFEVRLITFGAALQSIFVPDRSGRLADVVLGRDNLEGYLAVRRFLGATIGRYANRIANGTFELDGARFQLPTNDGANALHGGLAGFDRQRWTVIDIGESQNPLSRCLTSAQTARRAIRAGCKPRSPTASSGGMELSVEFTATTDRPTIVNLTNHSFFNLGGVESASGILDHRLVIAADTYLPVTASGIPLAGAAARGRGNAI